MGRGGWTRVVERLSASALPPASRILCKCMGVWVSGTLGIGPRVDEFCPVINAMSACRLAAGLGCHLRTIASQYTHTQI
ncbi:hypothetical protein B0T17DRAFT_534330 [Bombardia bombarda]|uniref:Uncharacterized protein n=1 Tax=Bombardia bombarda TaxID=252184 RepID=A0AA39WUF1_9PEZI|nr:hypothetical protein B0T17DRAFT_534330 [Bombardia bombarda]